MLDHKTSINKFRKTKIISCIFSDHDSIKLDINYRKKKKKNRIEHQYMEAKNMLPNNKQVNQGIKEEIKKQKQKHGGK